MQIASSNNAITGLRALRLQQVLEKTGLSQTHTYRLIGRGDHPKPIKLSERVAVWNEADVDAWLESKFEKDRHKPPALSNHCHDNAPSRAS